MPPAATEIPIERVQIAAARHHAAPSRYRWVSARDAAGALRWTGVIAQHTEERDVRMAVGDTVTRTIQVFVTDEDGEFLAGSKSLTVENVAPVLSISGAASTDEGAVYTLGIVGSDVAGPADPLEYAIDWGDGSPVQTLTAAELARGSAIQAAELAMAMVPSSMTLPSFGKLPSPTSSTSPRSLVTSRIAATSAAFDIIAGPATQLAFTLQPSTTTAGSVITPAIQVESTPPRPKPSMASAPCAVERRRSETHCST